MADLCGPTAEPSELRTDKLIGLRYRSSYLHDGRASGITQAVLFHDGEAAPAREAFDSLTEEARGYLIRFLVSL
jgi:CxxC motif-containing protein (DUF1111 family)